MLMANDLLGSLIGVIQDKTADFRLLDLSSLFKG